MLRFLATKTATGRRFGDPGSNPTSARSFPTPQSTELATANFREFFFHVVAAVVYADTRCRTAAKREYLQFLQPATCTCPRGLRASGWGTESLCLTGQPPCRRARAAGIFQVAYHPPRQCTNTLLLCRRELVEDFPCAEQGGFCLIGQGCDLRLTFL